MNFGEMREAFLSYTGITDDVDNAELALWFNEAQLDLAWEMAPVQTYTLVCHEGEAFSLPEDWLTVIGGDHPYRVTASGSIVPEHEGELQLYYRAVPNSFSGTDADEKSDLHKGLHYLLPIFAASRFWDKEAEGSGEETVQANRWLSYYYQGKNLAKARLFGVHEPMEAWEIRG